MDLSVVIPVYRSSEILPRLASRLLAVLDATGLAYELVFVEDASPDKGASWQALCQLREAHPDRIVAIQLMRNYGQHNAQMCGFRQARGNIVVTMDDDLQHPPEELPKLLDALKTGELDLVYGSYGEKQHSNWRNLGSNLVNTFYRLTFRSPITVTSYRAIRRQLVESTFTYNLNFTFIDGLFAWNTQRIGEVPIRHEERAAGKSGYNVIKLVTLAFNLFTNFSLLPLQVVSFLGFLAAGSGFLVAFYYLVQFLFQRIAVPGYASIIIAVLVLGGLQLLALGIMGEYLGRLHLNVNRKPQYTVRQVLKPDGSPPAVPLAGGNGRESAATESHA